MRYIFRGRLCGLLCADCREPLARVKVRLYDSAEQEQVIARAVASPKETFAVLDEDTGKAKDRLLIAEAETDEHGNFKFELDDRQQKYNGGAFEVDVYCESVPRQRLPRKPRPPRQFTITTLQPRWKMDREETSALYVWDYCLPYRFWCHILALFGLWTICGHVTTCDKDAVNVAGVKVSAFDADWWQEDPLGSAVTDAAGKFRIDYLAEDFQRTPFSPFVNLELFGGPDLYFKIEDSGGNTLLDETPLRARKPDRENVGNCFCVELCVDTDIPPPFDNPLFTHIGHFHVLTDINPASGLTNSAVLNHGGPGYGFYGAMELRGFCPKTSQSGSSLPMRYRFRYATLDDPATLLPITGNKVSDVIVGSRLIQWKLSGDVLAWTFQTIQISGAGATPDPTPTPGGPGPWGSVPTHVIVPDADGWINVDQNGLDDGFYGPLIGFNSAVALPGGGAPSDGVGNEVSVANQKNGVPIRIVFEAAPVGPDPDPPAGPDTFGNEVPNVYINNWNEVSLINLLQFEEGDASSCTELTNDLDIKYTADHELLAAFSLTITSAAAIPGAPLTLPSGTGPRGGFGTKHLDISTWASCSYIATLHTRRRLTNGLNDDHSKPNSLTFCVSGEDMG